MVRRLPTQLPFCSRARATRRVTLGLLFASPWLLSAAGKWARADDSANFIVIVNPNNPATGAPRSFFADAFLKAATRWDDGEPIRPVDLRSDSAIRRAFCDRVLKRSILAVRNYWQQRIFSGRDVPPPEFDSDEAVVAFVVEHRGGLGYVSKSAKLGAAKALSIQ
jgi:ABC-type phosphate transport system substrate-binding protein